MNGIRFEKAILSDFYFAVQISPKSNCIWTAANRMEERSLLFLFFQCLNFVLVLQFFDKFFRNEVYVYPGMLKAEQENSCDNGNDTGGLPV